MSAEARWRKEKLEATIPSMSLRQAENVTAASLATYVVGGKLVYEGCASQVVHPRGASRQGRPLPQVTCGWYVVNSCTRNARNSSRLFVMHGDDMCYSREDEDEDRLVKELAKVHKRVQAGMLDEVELQVAHPKTVALASSQSLAGKMCQRIGTERGVTTCKKLGVDYRLFGPDGTLTGRPGQTMGDVRKQAKPHNAGKERRPKK